MVTGALYLYGRVISWHTHTPLLVATIYGNLSNARFFRQLVPISKKKEIALQNMAEAAVFVFARFS